MSVGGGSWPSCQFLAKTGSETPFAGAEFSVSGVENQSATIGRLYSVSSADTEEI